MKHLLCTVAVLLLAAGRTSAQSRVDEYGYPFRISDDDYMPAVTADTSLFYRAVAAADDMFDAVTRYRLSFADNSRRGEVRYDSPVGYAGLSLPSRYARALRSLGAARTAVLPSAAAADNVLAATGGEEFSFNAAPDDRTAYAAAGFATRGYLASVRASVTTVFKSGWSLAAAVEGRTGRDLHVDGVFTNRADLSLRLTKRWTDDNSLTIIATASPSMRGLRSASSEEAFGLRGDNLYNPSWGWQNGRQRNSRIRREMVPLAAVTYDGRAGDATKVTISLAAEAGTQSTSSLGWYGTRTPLPDNYRYMPSYFTDAESADRMTDAWRRGDTRYTQVDWDELYEENRLAGGEALYAVEERVHRITSLSMAAGAVTQMGDALTVRYGIRAGYSSDRYYRRMRDLMGASYLTDLDYYIVDDDTYSSYSQNDMRHPDRRIGEGDRFGHDYALRSMSASAYASAEYHSGRFDMRAAARLGEMSVHRRGYFEKEIFPGNGSYGKSAKSRFTTYGATLTLGYAFTPRRRIWLSLRGSAEAPDAGDLYWNPQYNNLTVSRTPLTKQLGIDLGGRLLSERVKMEVSLFATVSRDGIRTLRYYDDLSYTFCDMFASRIDMLTVGAEAAAEVKVSRRWRISLAAAAMRCKYAGDPVIDIIADANNSTVASSSRSHMGGCTPGGVPQLSAAAGVDYYSPRGWSFTLSAGWLGARYAEPSLLRRTERMAYQGSSSPESFAAIVNQERLDDALNVDFAVAKRWYTGDTSRLTVMLSVRNLLGTRDTVGSAYESQRIRRISSGIDSVYEPLPTRRLYAYPRTANLTVSYAF